MTTFQVNDTVDFNDICFRKDVADVMFVMLPKVVATLQKVIHGEETQGHLIISVRAPIFFRRILFSTKKKCVIDGHSGAGTHPVSDF